MPFRDAILNILIVVLITLINNYYTVISLRSSKRENHRTNYSLNNSLVIKRFLFDLINRFTHFIFIAFIIKDIQSLKNLLNILFLIDEIRKVFTETIIPYIIKK